MRCNYNIKSNINRKGMNTKSSTFSEVFFNEEDYYIAFISKTKILELVDTVKPSV